MKRSVKVGGIALHLPVKSAELLEADTVGNQGVVLNNHQEVTGKF